MEVTLKQAFNLLDGRLSTEMKDVYEMLNFIYSTSFFTHQLPTAIKDLRNQNPKWFSDGVELINEIQFVEQTDDFDKLMEVIDTSFKDKKITLGKLTLKA